MLLAASLLTLVPQVAAAAPKSNLWVLSVGVSAYRDPSMNLAFAEKDARAVAATLGDQANRRIYAQVERQVLADAQVTRASILAAIRSFIERAGPEDVAVLFMAGHGVRDLLTGTYYFLPHDATATDFFTAGLRVEELSDMVRILQRHVRHVVVVLDTCHAGAVDLAGTSMTAADDFATRLRAEGVFLLAATRPGDKSKEINRLQHGVFTYALLNALRGGADTGPDGLLSLAELVLYLGAEVPRLTGGAQTPYYLIAGSDLVFADVRHPNSVVVFPFRNRTAGDAENAWMGRSLQERFAHELGRVPVLNICPLPSLDESGESLRSQARRQGCSTLVTGSYVVDREHVDLHARVVDTASDTDEVTLGVRGKRSEFAALEQRLVQEVLARMPTVRAYRMMLEAQGIGLGADAAPAPTPPVVEEPQSWWRPPLHWLLPVAPAYGQETARATHTPSLHDAVRALLERYRRAHEDKQIDSMRQVWDVFGARQQQALRRYFDQAGDLTLELSEVAIEPHEHEVTVAFTRVERFVDRESGKPVRLELRQRMILVRRDEAWKIARIESN